MLNLKTYLAAVLVALMSLAGPAVLADSAPVDQTQQTSSSEYDDDDAYDVDDGECIMDADGYC